MGMSNAKYYRTESKTETVFIQTMHRPGNVYYGASQTVAPIYSLYWLEPEDIVMTAFGATYVACAGDGQFYKARFTEPKTAPYSDKMADDVLPETLIETTGSLESYTRFEPVPATDRDIEYLHPWGSTPAMVATHWLLVDC